MVSATELHNPVTGHRYRLLHRDTDLLAMQVEYPAGASMPPDHSHPHQEERFEVLDGVLRVRLNGVLRALDRGEVLVIPAGTRHAMWTLEVPAVVRWEIRPALSSWEFFAATTRMAEGGRLDHAGRPRLLDGALLLHRFRREIRLPGLPPPVVAVLATLARLLGRS
jgi:hypothetical protein